MQVEKARFVKNNEKSFSFLFFFFFQIDQKKYLILKNACYFKVFIILIYRQAFPNKTLMGNLDPCALYADKVC